MWELQGKSAARSAKNKNDLFTRKLSPTCEKKECFYERFDRFSHKSRRVIGRLCVFAAVSVSAASLWRWSVSPPPPPALRLNSLRRIRRPPWSCTVTRDLAVYVLMCESPLSSCIPWLSNDFHKTFKWKKVWPQKWKNLERTAPQLWENPREPMCGERLHIADHTLILSQTHTHKNVNTYTNVPYLLAPQ